MKICLKKTFNRAIATALSIGILGNIAIPYVDAKENKFETFARKHPGVAISATIFGGIACAIGAGVGISKLSELAHVRSIHLYVDKMTDAEVEEELNKEIEKFEDYGKDEVSGEKYFIVSDEIKEKADKRVLLLIVNALLQLFENEKCGFLADALKNYLKLKNKKFEIGFASKQVDTDFASPGMSKYAIPLIYTSDNPGIYVDRKIGTSLYQAKKRSQNNLSIQRKVVQLFGCMSCNFIYILLVKNYQIHPPHHLILFLMTMMVRCSDIL